MMLLSPSPAAAPLSEPLECLVDARSGIVGRHGPGELPAFAPPGLRFHLAQLSPTDRVGAPLGSDTTSGCSWWDPTAALAAALGEAVEWYAGSVVPPGLTLASPDRLRSAGEPHVHPDDLVLYSEEQLATPGFPLVPFTGDLPVRWVTGRSLTGGDPRLVPASLVYLGYGTGPTAAEPLTNLPVNAGIAAALHWDDAVASALQEVIERDALAGAWTFGLPLEPLTPPEWFAAYLGADEHTRWTFHQLPTVVDVPGVLAVVRHRGTGVVGAGAAVRADPVRAAFKAAAEAVVSSASALELDRPGSPANEQLASAVTLKPWREDRAYTRDYREDWRDVLCIPSHQQLYLDPVLQQQMDDRLASLAAGRPEVQLEDLPSVEEDNVDDGSDRDRSGPWVELLTAAGYEALAVDITTSDVAGLGWWVARTLVPGLRATTPAAFPLLGDVPDPRRQGAGSVHLAPVPHA